MAVSRFSGPIVSKQGIAADFTEPNTPISGQIEAVKTLLVQAVAQTNTDFTLSLPVGATVLEVQYYTTVAFTGGTPTIALGNAVGGAQYSAATAPTAGVVTAAFAATVAAAAGLLSFPGTLVVRLNQASAPTAVGTATVVVRYAIPLSTLTP